MVNVRQHTYFWVNGRWEVEVDIYSITYQLIDIQTSKRKTSSHYTYYDGVDLNIAFMCLIGVERRTLWIPRRCLGTLEYPSAKLQT